MIHKCLSIELAFTATFSQCTISLPSLFLNCVLGDMHQVCSETTVCWFGHSFSDKITASQLWYLSRNLKEELDVYLSGGLSNVEGWCRTVCESIISTTHFVLRSISSKTEKNALYYKFFLWIILLENITSPVKRPNSNSDLNLVIRHCYDKYLYAKDHNNTEDEQYYGRREQLANIFTFRTEITVLWHGKN